MIDFTALQKAFPEVSDIRLLQGSSGQKFVFQVRVLDQLAVLKIIKKGMVDLPRTEREISAVAKLNSPYVPRIISSGIRYVGLEEQIYILETMVDGISYREILRAKPVQEISIVISHISAFLEACSDFQQSNLVHRDLKPENIMLAKDGKIWVIDFGIVRDLGLHSLTADGLYGGIGTLGYAAPEQFQNIKAEINVRADLFAIGVMGFESLAGYNPFLRGLHTQQAVIKRMETETIPPLTICGDKTGVFSKFISSMIHRFPSRRPQSAEEAIRRFEAVKNQYK